MGFKCGIVGLPNVGKSIFNALTKAGIEAAKSIRFVQSNQILAWYQAGSAFRCVSGNC